MKVLIITPRIPFPLKDGGAIAMYNICLGLKENGATIDLFSYNTSKHFVDLSEKIEALAIFNKIKAVPVNNKISVWGAFSNLFSNRSYNTARFISTQFAIELENHLKQNTYDVIQCETIYSALYLDLIKKHAPNAILSYRAHNIEHNIWKQLAKQASGLKQCYLQLMANRLQKEEKELILKFDTIITITQVDKEWFLNKKCKQIFVSSTGISHFKLYEEKQSPIMQIGFLGSLDWMPNVEGVKWFVQTVWPDVIKTYGNVTFNIAGRNCPQEIFELNKVAGVTVVGEIEDATQFICSNHIMVVPLLSGSGMRIKVVEEMALSVPIVATKIGVEGIEVSDGKHCYIAANSQEFIEKTISLLTDSIKQKQLAEEAYIFVKNTYSNTTIVNHLVQYYQNLRNA